MTGELLIIEQLFHIGEKLNRLMALVAVDDAKITAANDALKILVNDTPPVLKNILDEIASLKANPTVTADPAASASLDAIAAAATNLDASIKAADPGPIQPAGGGQQIP